MAKPERKIAPDVKVSKAHRDLRSEQLQRLDSENPEFVHMYQHPGVMAGEKGRLWEMKVKGQEVVKDAEGNVLHHMGDPVVRMPRAQFEEDRAAESDRSRSDVEAVVKPERSTVFKSPAKQPLAANPAKSTDGG